ncbi:hypothetical protein Psch_03388 [Pelotomaculum schinkii]|uniref:LppX_LprAFG lipoprotein n=1 Tax=Pelotomaculum schinkii TaxID=78350 RepID=A0A4Y7R788_9FIRM|nr:hypothetical protein [Pelotomaculum schinkii]TEB04626.1 hypothetical protein Psch_03388 [Pelotomaculum schinkii]
MQRPRWLVLKRRAVVPSLALALVLFLVIWGVGQLISRGAGKVPPREMLKTGLEKTKASVSFRYQAETRLTSEGKSDMEFFSKVEGEMVAPANIHMQGTMMNTPIEFIQVGDSSYFKDQPSGRWVTLTGNRLADSELFYAELNPLAYFNFKDVPELKYAGTEKVNGETLLLLEMRPNLMDPFLELRLTDYYYKVWLSPEDYRLRQAVLQAKDKHNPKGGIEINLRFWDYDKVPPINPPV